MTHKEILNKFYIEYDKEGNSISSYPSLTEPEIAAVLNKAYLAIIAEKLTGNNPRRSTFEGDIKAIEDIRPLIITESSGGNEPKIIPTGHNIDNGVQNEETYQLPSDMLYFLQAVGEFEDGQKNITLVSHDTAKQFFQTTTNTPWIKDAICFIEGNTIAVLYDPYSWTSTDEDGNEVKSDPKIHNIHITYIHEPVMFTKDNFDDTPFELSDTMAEELINLAIIMTLETVESQRLTTKVSTRGLEA